VGSIPIASTRKFFENKNSFDILYQNENIVVAKIRVTSQVRFLSFPQVLKLEFTGNGNDRQEAGKLCLNIPTKKL
jgi:hypothetical protein